MAQRKLPSQKQLQLLHPFFAIFAPAFADKLWPPRSFANSLDFLRSDFRKVQGARVLSRKVLRPGAGRAGGNSALLFRSDRWQVLGIAGVGGAVQGRQVCYPGGVTPGSGCVAMNDPAWLEGRRVATAGGSWACDRINLLADDRLGFGSIRVRLKHCARVGSFSGF
jgi:hypothetical protein